MIHCPLYNHDFDAEKKEDLSQVDIGCTQYEKGNWCKSRIGNGLCVAEEAEDE